MKPRASATASSQRKRVSNQKEKVNNISGWCCLRSERLPPISGSESSTATSLLNHHVYLISVLHLEFVRCVIVLESLTVEDESALVARETLPLAVGIHEFLELRRPLDLEEDLSAILRFHLYVDVLRVSRVGRTSSCRRGSLSVCSS